MTETRAPDQDQGCGARALAASGRTPALFPAEMGAAARGHAVAPAPGFLVPVNGGPALMRGPDYDVTRVSGVKTRV